MEKFDKIYDRIFDYWYNMKKRNAVKEIGARKDGKSIKTFRDFLNIFHGIEIDETDDMFFTLGFDQDILKQLEEKAGADFDNTLQSVQNSVKQDDEGDETSSDEADDEPIIPPPKKKRRKKKINCLC